MRAARAFRKRDKILKFEGGYHGMSDYSLMASPQTVRQLSAPVPDSAGIPQQPARRDIGRAVQRPRDGRKPDREHQDELAGVIVEPFQRIIPPAPGFLRAAQDHARHGIPLIFDEVVTGFRFAYGGAQEYYGVVPDLCTLGKVIGGGFPLAAIAGRADIMAHFDRSTVGDEGFLMQIGTLSGNPVAAAAGLATLEILRRPGAYERLFATGRELMGTLAELLKGKGLAGQVTGEPPLFDVVFSGEPVRDYRGTLRGDAEMLRRFNALLRERGVLKGELKYYVSLAHTPGDVRLTREAWSSAISLVAP